MKPSSAHAAAWALFEAGQVLGSRSLSERGPLDKRNSLHKRADCGPGIGSCDPGDCCSGAGWCGTGGDYCGGSQCQLDYSDSCDTFFGPPGPSTEDIPRPKIGDVPYGIIVSDCTVSGNIALTFDDGPYIYTAQILDILDELEVKATFFIAGNNKGKGHIDDDSTDWPGIMRRMYAAGHHIASHTWTHRDLNQVNSTIRRTEMIYNEMAFRNLFGWIPTYMRPPYLECSDASGCEDLQRELGYHVVTNDIDTKDYQFDDPNLIQQAKDRFSAGVSTDPENNEYITLAHDVHYQTVVNLTAFMVDVSRNRGYQLVTVGECLGDPPENWYRDANGGATPTNTVTLSSTSSPSATSYATPTATLIISPDQTCGGSTSHTCFGSPFGNCCSHYGFCGSTPTYCGTGCDADFGTCDPKPDEIADTTNGLCGPEFLATCLNFGTKTCCSQYNFCGSTAGHCGTGCQGDYGNCANNATETQQPRCATLVAKHKRESRS